MHFKAGRICHFNPVISNVAFHISILHFVLKYVDETSEHGR